MKLSQRLATLASVVAFGLLVGAPVSAQAAMNVPPASLTEVDVPGTTALGAAFPAELSRYGYAEHEYYVAGTANRYRITDPLADAQVVDGGWPYKTRILVRTPRRGSFNGTVLVEWNNVTLGQDMDFIWQAAKDYLMREGYAVVTVSAQKVGVANLKTWSPARYGDLSLDASNTDPAGGTLDARGDVLSWDVFSQVVKALRAHGNEALRGLNAKRVIAAGESQSASRLTTYFNSIDPLHRLVDGVIYYDRAGPLRPDSPTKVMDVATEVFPVPAAPDTATQRHWEIAGASHISFDESRRVDATMARDNAVGNTISGLITGCTYMPLFSTIPNWMVVSAGIDNLDSWIKGGAAPSAAPRLVRGSDGLPIYDADGRAQGGIQLTQYKDPLAFFLPRNGGSAFCVISGHHRFYTQDELANLYPDRGAFVRDVITTTKYNLRKGYILRPEAIQTIVDELTAFGQHSATG